MRDTMHSETANPPVRNAQRRARYAAALTLLLASALSVTGLATSQEVASAATTSINQCNNIDGSPSGATTGLTCTVTVVNTINGNTRGSTTTVTRQCSLGPCPPGNGTFTTTSTSLVTTVTQCNGSANDAAPPLVTCRVSITNNISAGTPGASPVSTASVNQCVGSGTGGGKYNGTGPLICNPYPASTTGATVTQCNGSATGGGSTVACSVAPTSKVSAAIPMRVNQCNGTGNKGGTLVTCSVSITTNITRGATAGTSGAPGSTPGTSGAGGSTPGTSGAGGTLTGTAGAPAQITRVPTGGIASGDGSTSGLQHGGLLELGAGLLMAATITFRLRRRPAASARRE